jgi:hypothetical protein
MTCVPTLFKDLSYFTCLRFHREISLATLASLEETIVRIIACAVGIATGYELDDREVGVRVLVGSRIVPSPSHPDRLWGPPSLLSNGYRDLFPQG